MMDGRGRSIRRDPSCAGYAACRVGNVNSNLRTLTDAQLYQTTAIKAKRKPIFVDFDIVTPMPRVSIF